MKQYPPITTSVYTFEEIISKGGRYIDKTDYFYRLVSDPWGIFFMSRPRRFGKSLSVSILDNIFNGKKDLFKGLKIYDTDYDWTVYPVINLNISKVNCISIAQMNDDLCDLILKSARDLNIQLAQEQRVASSLFRKLIEKASEKAKVVILIDEYDKPLVDNINAPLLDDIRQVLGDFYINIKANDQYLRFVFMTGVTKFSKVSVFSKLNNLNDITMDADYACLYGYTQEELEHYFGDQITDLAIQHQMDPKDYRKKIKIWYNGYQFSKNALTVYNPVSIGSFINKGGDFADFWFATGSPSLLLEVLKEKKVDFFKMIHGPITDSQLDSFDVSNMEPAPLLLQTGYLTIDRAEVIGGSICYYLRFPNREVENAFERHLVSMLSRKSLGLVVSDIINMQLALRNNDTATLCTLIKAHLASIPYGKRMHIEKTYQNIIFSLFRLLGAEIQNEVHTNLGRIDAVITTDTHIYILEFKTDESAIAAIDQINEKGYKDAYQASGKKVMLIGINFSNKLRNIDEWKEVVINCEL